MDPSLLPYLIRHPVGISIQLDTAEQHIPTQDDAVDVSGPFSQLRNGHVIVDGHQRLLDVMFVTQSDIYAGVHSELRPPTNLDVESIWQQTWAQMKALNYETGPIVLPCQIGDNGALTPFRSLFYCSHKDIYCHPLCPDCGNPLALCSNDDYLEKAGLPAYSKSLYRYLFCSDCHQKSDAACFYARTLKCPSSAVVKDSHALVQAFGHLLAKSDLADRLPCIGCAESVHCYGPDMLALNRMQPLQFYPFHMLIYYAPALNALDFLALVSGARPREHFQVKGSGFFFEQDDRMFIETLCLKLMFLYELLVLISSDLFTPVSRMSLAGIGVDIKTQGAHLPYLWNFSLRLINPIDMPATHPPGSKVPQTLIHEFLGRAWFYVLLVNSTQQMVELNTAIDEYLVKERNPEMSPKELFCHDAFDPGNIFWQPQSIEPAFEEYILWAEALKLGITLVHAGSASGSDFSPADFGTRLKELINRVRQYLFNTSTVATEPKNAPPDDINVRIEAILSGILEQWSRSSGYPKSESTHNSRKSRSIARGPVYQDGDDVENEKLSSEDAIAPNSTPPPQGNDSQIPETVVVSDPIHLPNNELPKIALASPSEKKSAPPASLNVANTADGDQTNKAVENELEKTVIVQDKKNKWEISNHDP
jgi:hypothetical protein